MRPICVAVPEILYEQLEALAQERNLKISDIVRMFLRTGLDNKMSGEFYGNETNRLQQQIANYTIMAYCLIESAMQNLVTEGPMLSEKSHAKAEKLIDHLLSKLARTSAMR